jgi:hypothetical protein
MPNRILREGILTSPRIARLGWAEEVFCRRLHSVVDDFGRYYADPGMLRAACYPRQLSKVSDSDIGKWLTVLVEAALVRVYPAEDGERYLEVLDFGQQVRAKKSKFPDPPSVCVADAQQPPADAHLDVSVSVSVSEGVTRATRCPPDFEPSPEPEAEAGIDRRTELLNFRDYWTAKPGKDGLKLDWQATWRNWCRKAHRKPADVARMTVPGPSGPDPALQKLKADAEKAVPMPTDVRQALAQVTGKLTEKTRATA